MLVKNKENTTQNLIPGCDSYIKGVRPESVPLLMSGIYVVLYIIQPWDELFPWLGALHFERYYFLFMFASVVLSSNRQKIESTPQTTAILMFVFALFLSWVFAYNSTLAWDEFYKYLTISVFYFILLSTVRTPYDLLFIVSCFVFAMTLYLVKAEWEFFIHGRHVYRMGVVRMVGIESLYGSPNSLSMSILAVLPITLFLRKIKNRITETWPPFYRRSFVIILYVNLVLSVLGIALTNSRGGMVAFICYILILVFLNQKKFTTKVRYGVAGALFLCILWSVLPVDKQARLETVWNPEAGPKNATTSAMGRIEGLKAGVEMFEDYPFSGVGLGNFIPYRVAYIDEVPLNSHNLVGQLLGETGLLGLLTFSLLIATLLRNIKKIQALSSKVRLPTDNIMYAFSRACRDSLYMLLFLGMFNHNLKRYNWFWLAAFILLALKFVRDKCDESKLKSN